MESIEVIVFKPVIFNSLQPCMQNFRNFTHSYHSLGDQCYALPPVLMQPHQEGSGGGVGEIAGRQKCFFAYLCISLGPAMCLFSHTLILHMSMKGKDAETQKRGKDQPSHLFPSPSFFPGMPGSTSSLYKIHAGLPALE